MSYQSKYTGEEIDNKLDKVGEVGVLDHCYCDLPSIAPEAGQILSLQYRSGNMKLQDGKVIIKSGQSVQINMSIAYSGVSTNASIKYTIKDFTNNIDIQSFNPYRGDPKHEYGSSISAQFTNDTDSDCEIGIYVSHVTNSDTLRGEYSCFTVHEIGRAMVIPSGGLTELPIANGEDYSTEEKRIGTWIDGKPLYQKVIILKDLGTLPASKSFFAHGIQNVDNMWISDGYMLTVSTGHRNTLGSPYRYFGCTSTDMFVVATTEGNYNPYHLYFVVKYTKTTD